MHPETGVLALGPVLPLLVTECVTRARAELADPGPSLADVLAVAEAEEAAFLACPDWPGTGPGRSCIQENSTAASPDQRRWRQGCHRFGQPWC